MRNFRGLAAGLACLHIHCLKLCERTLSFAFSRAGRGQVAWLESPNGLGATAEFQLPGDASRIKFPAIFCRRSTSLRNEPTDKPLFAVCPRARANKKKERGGKDSAGSTD